jgi:alpha-tubulin suppressor-like RCC1 family protein
MREWDLQPAASAAAKAGAAAAAPLPSGKPPPDADGKMSAVPKRVVQLSDILAVAAGTNHTAVACARGVYTFGANSHGQLGLGNLNDSHVPVRVKVLSQARDSITQARASRFCALLDGVRQSCSRRFRVSSLHSWPAEPSS